MIYAIIAAFGVAAILGITILGRLLSAGATPKPVVYAHGIFAATGLVLLIVYIVNHAQRSPKTSLILFILAALGGFYLFFRDMSKKKIPIGVAVVHALLAVIAFVILLITVLK
jgi:tryptophan-rich sensory protein